MFLVDCLKLNPSILWAGIHKLPVVIINNESRLYPGMQLIQYFRKSLSPPTLFHCSIPWRSSSQHTTLNSHVRGTQPSQGRLFYSAVIHKCREHVLWTVEGPLRQAMRGISVKPAGCVIRHGALMQVDENLSAFVEGKLTGISKERPNTESCQATTVW